MGKGNLTDGTLWLDKSKKFWCLLNIGSLQVEIYYIFFLKTE